jgi:hypothetical protein
VNANLRAAKSSGRIDKYPISDHQLIEEEGQTITELFFDGYHQGEPASVRARFYHNDQRPSKTEVVIEDLAHSRIYGSAVIANLVFNSDDPRFADYRRRDRNVRIDLPEAIQIAKNYFRACADPVARSIDERSCSSIGGHVHIAQITHTHGFSWVIPPKEGGPYF